MSTSARCQRCQRKHRGQLEWNGTFRRGVLVAITCPKCQTAEENAEAEINLATLRYTLDASGRLRGAAR